MLGIIISLVLFCALACSAYFTKDRATKTFLLTSSLACFIIGYVISIIMVLNLAESLGIQFVVGQ